MLCTSDGWALLATLKQVWVRSFCRWEKQVSKIAKFLALGGTASKHQNRSSNPHLPGNFNHFCQIYSEVLDKCILKSWQNKSSPFQRILIWICHLFLHPCCFSFLSCWFSAVICASTASMPQVPPLVVTAHCPYSLEMPSFPLGHIPGLPSHTLTNFSVFSCKLYLFIFCIVFLCVCLSLGPNFVQILWTFLISIFCFIKSNWAAFK